jgi:hypothetical protein
VGSDVQKAKKAKQAYASFDKLAFYTPSHNALGVQKDVVQGVRVRTTLCPLKQRGRVKEHCWISSFTIAEKCSLWPRECLIEPRTESVGRTGRRETEKKRRVGGRRKTI